MAKKRADILLYKSGQAKSREYAKRLIMEGVVYVDTIRVMKPGDFYEEDTVFNLKNSNLKYVSRGGLKLEKALSAFNIVLKDKICADFGASTGGFTDCMLQNGAKKVYSIDVGYGQIDYKLREDDRVILMERTNIRYLNSDEIKEKLDFISIDVSFISLELILPKAFENLNNNGSIVCLIKPQFEAGREKVGKKGIVKSKDVHFEVVEKIYNFVEDYDYKMTAIEKSPITGAKGNVEFLALIEKSDCGLLLTDLEELIYKS
ncbi:MAG: TlyA family RNA methyltransferase [Tissierellia bacterium]|nr:TlyA family RNA methyltransferase [Tissierellia bacterium]